MKLKVTSDEINNVYINEQQVHYYCLRKRIVFKSENVSVCVCVCVCVRERCGRLLI